jgi:serine/threonine protein kinase
MGVVYEVRQEHPVRRTLALERQALAMMNHPNVAKVFDAGATEQGRPYFTMEYVDFGVAKATQQRLTERSLYTERGMLIGTPEYMSPEQAELTGLDVDTRTDVYSLGVVLYELPVGALPFDSKTLREAGFDEIRRRIREEEPPKPSTRGSTLGGDSTKAARCRRTDPASLRRELSGDMDWITMKALEKDRTRRYAVRSRSSKEPSGRRIRARGGARAGSRPCIGGPATSMAPGSYSNAASKDRSGAWDASIPSSRARCTISGIWSWRRETSNDPGSCTVEPWRSSGRRGNPGTTSIHGRSTSWPASRRGKAGANRHSSCCGKHSIVDTTAMRSWRIATSRASAAPPSSRKSSWRCGGDSRASRSWPTDRESQKR